MASNDRQKRQGANGKGPAKAGATASKKKGRRSGPSVGVIVAIAVAIAAVGAGALFLFNGRSTGANAKDVAVGNVAGSPEIDALLQGIPQKGLVLGFDEAPATLVEYGDLRCPACKQWDNETAPKVIDQLVRTKKAKLEFRFWPITRDAEGTNTDAINAARAGTAAAGQDRFWNFALLFYKNQPDESTTYVTDEFARGMAKAAGVPDLAKFDAARADSTVEATIQQHTADAAQYGFNGTPSFLTISPSGQSAPLKADPTDVAAIEQELAGLK